MRKNNTFRKHLSERVSKIVIHTIFKNLERPDTSEGFDDVVVIRFVESFENDEDKEFYNVFLS
jgi:hypothetical protein